jgi:Na+-driven multidrug efflux pump
MLGINSTLNTLVSQSYGLGNYKLCGIYLNRSRILVTMTYVPLLGLLLKADAIFSTLGFDETAAYYS